MTDNKVSIITPCYNGAKYIAFTIESVLKQNYTDYEMIIVNDGSKDNSEEIVRKYAEADSRIKLINQANAGSAAARNNGIRNAEGRYIALLDADDMWDENFLEEQLKAMEREKVSVVCSAYRRIDSSGQEIMHPTVPREHITVKDMRVMNHVGCLTGLYDTKAHGKVYLHEELKSLRDDYAYWYDVIALDGRAYGNQSVLASYRVLDNSTTGKKGKLIKVQYRFYREYLKENIVSAFINVVRWGIAGVFKFR